ncbi:hypothetical protein PMAC_000856 [Pneumocystis sp. 'macacae']|nr:hypothetical protein PMAC_000856 [Pneumocystis sp. 'macacae']
MNSAAAKINWTKLRSCYGLNATTISSLSEFRKRNSDAWTKVHALQEQTQNIDFDHYRSILKNHTVLNQIEKDIKTFKPLKCNTDAQIKVIDLFKAKALESAIKTADNVRKELIFLQETLSNIQKARPIEDLTVEDVLTACPEIEKKVEKMVENGQWSVPGYKEKFGNLTIMLAATLGSKSSLKRLQKKEVLSVNVPKACEYLSEPPEPLALRLSSNLMVGVTRIFDQQYSFFYTDVQLTHAKIRKELTAMTIEKTNIDLPPVKMRSDHFTLPDDPTFIPDLNDHGWNRFMPLLETSFDIEMGLQEDTSSSFNLSETPISFSQRTLPRSSFSSSNTASKLEFAGSISRSAISINSLIEKDNDILGSVNGELSFDFEFNADGEIRKIDVDQEYSENFIQEHDNISSKFDLDKSEENFGETLMAYEEVDETVFDEYTKPEILKTKESSFVQNKTDETSSDTHENDNQRSKKRKIAKLKTDISTELPSENLISWRDNYVKNMEKQSILRIRKLQEKAAINNADFFIWNLLGEAVHPTLKTLFLVNQKDLVKYRKRPRDDDYEFSENKMNANYIQIGRSTEIQSNFEEDIELGRHVNEELARRTSSLMPWNQSHISSHAGSIGPGMASISFDTPKMGGVGQIPSTGRKSRLTASPLSDRLDDININVEDAMEDFDIFGTTNPNTQIISYEGYQSTIMEKESYNFLEYGKGRTITFEELVPTLNSSRSVASQALCHILLLASRNILAVHQIEPYQDIWIRLS